MNQTIAHPFSEIPGKRPQNRHQLSLASQLLDRLRDWLNSSRSRCDDKVECRTFLEANLLDSTVGTEIKRTLRI